MKIIIKVFDWREHDDAEKFYIKMKKLKLKVWDYGTGSDTYVLVAAKKTLTHSQEESYMLDEDVDKKLITNLSYFN